MREGTKYFKDGDPEVYRYFNNETWKRMTAKEKAMWTPYSEAEQAPIPEAVLEFNKAREPDAADLKAALKQAITEEVIIPSEDASEPEDEKAAKELLIAELKSKGIKANMNYKLETLQKKLEDANNSE